MNHWVWVVAPEGHLDEHGRERLAPGQVATRCCAPTTVAGDTGVLYRSRQAKDVAYVLRAVSGAGAGGRCEVEVLERLPRPVPLTELRADPVTARWSALRASFVRRVAPMPDEVWRRVLELGGSQLTARTPPR